MTSGQECPGSADPCHQRHEPRLMLILSIHVYMRLTILLLWMMQLRPLAPPPPQRLLSLTNFPLLWSFWRLLRRLLLLAQCLFVLTVTGIQSPNSIRKRLTEDIYGYMNNPYNILAIVVCITYRAPLTGKSDAFLSLQCSRFWTCSYLVQPKHFA